MLYIRFTCSFSFVPVVSFFFSVGHKPATHRSVQQPPPLNKTDKKERQTSERTMKRRRSSDIAFEDEEVGGRQPPEVGDSSSGANYGSTERSEEVAKAAGKVVTLLKGTAAPESTVAEPEPETEAEPEPTAGQLIVTFKINCADLGNVKSMPPFIPRDLAAYVAKQKRDKRINALAMFLKNNLWAESVFYTDGERTQEFHMGWSQHM